MEKSKDVKSKKQNQNTNNMEVQSQSNVGIHYLCFSLFEAYTDTELSELIIKFFGITLPEFFEVNKQRNMYNKRYVYKSMITVNVNAYASNKNTTYFEIKGQGCELLGLERLLDIIKYVIIADGNITRTDICFDDYDKLLDFKKITECWDDYKNRIVSRFKHRPEYRTNGVRESYRFGESSSDTKINIYNRGTYYDFEYPCIRCEIQMKNKMVLKAFFERFIYSDVHSTQIFAQEARKLLRGYLDFVRKGTKTKNKRESEKWWQKFLDNEPKMRLGVKKPVAKTLDKKRLSSKNQITNIIKTIGEEEFIRISMQCVISEGLKQDLNVLLQNS